jgi:hypothetical protein
VLVLEKDQPLDEVAVGLGKAERRGKRRLRPRRLAQYGRHADVLAGFQARVRLHAAGIEAHLARAQQLLQMAVADIRKVRAKPAVQPHAGLIGRDLDGVDGGVHGSSDRAACIPA